MRLGSLLAIFTNVNLNYAMDLGFADLWVFLVHLVLVKASSVSGNNCFSICFGETIIRCPNVNWDIGKINSFDFFAE